MKSLKFRKNYHILLKIVILKSTRSYSPYILLISGLLKYLKIDKTVIIQKDRQKVTILIKKVQTKREGPFIE